jgi:ubiquinone/menaquinone biosynthesis C-methylase UbiE
MSRHNDTRSAYDRFSRWYDWFASSEELFIRQAIFALALQPGERILEIGCGTGKALLEMGALAGLSGRVLGVDLSFEMARCASRRIHADDNVHIYVCQGDASVMPCPAAFFDSVLMTFTLELFPLAEIPEVLSECRRLLRPGGRLAVVSLLETEKPAWMECAYGWAHHHFPRLIDCRPIRAGKILADNGFLLRYQDRQSLWGLPVEVLVAGKPPAGTC